jgi:hypothetical protein
LRFRWSYICPGEIGLHVRILVAPSEKGWSPLKEDDELDDAFVEAVAREASRTLPEGLVKSYLDFLAEKGYLLLDFDHAKITDKFGDLVMEAAEDLEKRGTITRQQGNLLAALAWRMTRIVLEQDHGGDGEDINPEEVGRLMNVIDKLLQLTFKDTTVLREALHVSVNYPGF